MYGSMYGIQIRKTIEIFKNFWRFFLDGNDRSFEFEFASFMEFSILYLIYLVLITHIMHLLRLNTVYFDAPNDVIRNARCQIHAINKRKIGLTSND